MEQPNNPIIPNPNDIKPVVTPANGGGEGKKDEETVTKTFSQEDIDRIAGETRKTVRDQMEKDMQTKIDAALAEERRLTKLSQEDREKEIRSRQEKELSEKERELTLRENKLEGINKLNELKMPITFIDFVVSDNKDVMAERITSLEKVYSKAVTDGVAEILKGKPPVDPVNGDDKSKENTKGSNFF